MILRRIRSGRNRADIRDGVGSSSDGLVAGLAVPDSGRVSLDGGLAAESADVLGVLGDFHLLHLLSERGTISIVFKYHRSAIHSSCSLNSTLISHNMYPTGPSARIQKMTQIPLRRWLFHSDPNPPKTVETKK